VPGWLGGNASPHIVPGHRLSLLIQAMAAMPVAAAETTGFVAAEPPPPVLVVPST
jgi:hypothetical protein